MWSESIVLSSNYCKDKRGIVGEKNVMSLQVGNMLMYCLSFVSIMM